MTTAKHLKLLLYSFITWAVFYGIGLPDYYQSWPLWTKLGLVALVTWLYFPVSRMTLLRCWDDGRHRQNSLWLALYLTLPLFVYDYLLLGLYFDLGIGFTVPYWYLTAFYFSFWIQIPWIGARMERRRAAANSSLPGEVEGADPQR